MRALVKALEWLRPLVETKSWDYCIVWKFGDDPSRYIEWIGCCCSGSQGVCKNVKEENGHLPQLCRDAYVTHPVRTMACEKLAHIPLFLPLYSGIHGEVAMSNQPSWLCHDSLGTQALIVVNGGLIELFSSHHVPKDEKLMETLMSQFSILMNREQTMSMTNPKVEGSPTVSNQWSEHSSLISAGSTQVSPTRSIGKPMNSLSYAKLKENMKIKQKMGKEQYQSKNLVTERNRRNRIKDGLFALRALVPKISKMDRASILGDAIEYIKELQTNVEELQDELKKLENEEGEVEVCNPKMMYSSPTKAHRDVPMASEMQVEAHQIGPRDFLLKLVCTQKRGAFMRIMEALECLGLRVIDVNVTTCNGKVLNILKVEAKGKEFVAKSLIDSLLTSWSS